MPVSIVDSGLDSVGPFNRLSASQANAYEACKRLWYYEKVLKFKILQVPILHVGKAVEESFCRMLKESPALIQSNASHSTLSNIPIDENGQPERNNDKNWPASRLLKLPPSSVPSTISELRNWAISRIDVHLPIVLEKEKKNWENEQRKSGDWQDVDYDYCREMCINALDFHLTEVNNCIDNMTPQILDDWRSGKRDLWPSPDGFGYRLNGDHPLAESGDMQLSEAWEIVRPWFVEPETDNFSMNSIHPDYWFQGEYDLVYRWDGNIKIVDIKASKGSNDRSGDYVKQLRIYAMLWWATHGKQEFVDKLEIWYLGANIVKDVQVPTEKELRDLETYLQSLWSEIKYEIPSIEDCPPMPLPLREFLEGGVATKTNSDNKRCDFCDWKLICPGGTGSDNFINKKSFQIPGSFEEIETVPIVELNVRMTLKAEVKSIIYDNGLISELKVLESGKLISVEFARHKDTAGELLYPNNILTSEEIILEDIVMINHYKFGLTAKIDPLSKITRDMEKHCSTIANFRERWNVAGKLVYKYQYSFTSRAGNLINKKGMMVMDSTGAIKVEGWLDSGGPQFDMAEIGQDILITNISLNPWASINKGEMQRYSKVHILE